MSVLKNFLAAVSAILILGACQKEMSLELGLSSGTLREDGTGRCLPSTVNGKFKEDSLLNTTHFIEIQLNIIEAGTYIIKSDTINGYSFYGSGSIDNPGLNTVKLKASGRPADVGVNTFTITYDSSSCLIDVTVVAVGPPAVYTLGGTGSTCTGVVVNGTYMMSVPMTPANTITINVTVATIGSYELTTNTVNGISFSASGEFISASPQTVTLNAIGTPTAAGNAIFTLTGNSGSCSFTVPISSAAGPAQFTYGGAGGNCTGVTPSGTYTAGTALNPATNTVSVNVDVQTIGSYSISTTATNNVTFTKIGAFTVTGPQTVTLVGSGTPTASGIITHTITGTGGCSFAITYAPAAAPAQFTLVGAPTACTPATVAGTYTAGTLLTVANTVTVRVNVTVLGAYNLTTNAVNGMTFSKSGAFTVTGAQDVILTGSGTPTTAGANTFTIQGASGCTFSITTAPGTSTSFIRMRIDGGALTTFNFNAMAAIDNSSGFEALTIDGQATASQDPSVTFGLVKLSPGAITTGTYTVNQFGTGILLDFSYFDAGGIEYFSGTDPFDQTQNPGFTIVITSINSTRIVGTFSGLLKDNSGAGPGTRTITAGEFSVDF